jgi:L-rhamnose-H+ transport protein
MTLALFLGAALIFVAGVLQGTFAVPMKYAHKWKHENIWLVFSLTGMVIFPWLLTAAVVPSLRQVYAATSAQTLWSVVLFGLLWGVGATLTGIGLRLLGVGLGLAIILGLSASIGSLVPLLVLTPGKLFTAQGYIYLIGTLVMLGGIAVVAVAGSLRQRAEDAAQGIKNRGKTKTPFVAGLLVCIASGVLSSTLNFSFAFGTEAIANARQLGASVMWAPNVVAAPATTGGFLANFLYCAYRMWRDRSAGLYWRPGTGGHWLLGVMMGVFWYGGLAVYGMGIDQMGSFGTVAGWPLLMGTIIVSSNAAGLATGEWRKAGTLARGYLFGGSIIILAALAILALAQGH